MGDPDDGLPVHRLHPHAHSHQRHRTRRPRPFDHLIIVTAFLTVTAIGLQRGKMVRQ